ncbi:uncharacterized protein L969DRAFT_14069 [Mixia osmundae IAM 14324]|uniref:Uncharacterized protein n=1 Tax=Mixia osmundae (strain CBS 9802 / IAM 14324 / JCM 22182 / KY 12970) TaxID=764103 RepID=G7E4L4_MIXOS|nr:uncharacterized protein L969DRAFT_14069 [Mixia osmundae IAM 14324]KEI41846.1 hypothetical protein L969DRAFT_14069 [Mixia osmundae IAM 14324]GAA97774.1 hypothetical protein E5Q_04453 [Mixia osmundae IAM 14324]
MSFFSSKKKKESALNTSGGAPSSAANTAPAQPPSNANTTGIPASRTSHDLAASPPTHVVSQLGNPSSQTQGGRTLSHPSSASQMGALPLPGQGGMPARNGVPSNRATMPPGAGPPTAQMMQPNSQYARQSALPSGAVGGQPGAPGYNSLPANATKPLSNAVPSQGKGAPSIVYPWSQRSLHLLPISPFPDGSPPNAAKATARQPSPMPFPRYGHSVNPLAAPGSGDIYVFGGLVADQVKNDLYVLQANPNSTSTPGLDKGAPGTLSVGLVETRGEIPGPRVGHASVGVGNVLIIWGGDTKQSPDDIQDDGLYLLNLSTREWTRVKVAGPAPEGRYGHAAAMVGSRFYVFGGQKDDGEFLNDMWSFDLQNLKTGMPRWQEVRYADIESAPPRRTGHTSITHGDCIYIFGGTDGQYHYNDTWSFDTITTKWTELSCIGYIPVPREGHAATLVDDVMYVFGGRGVDGKDLEDLAAFRITNQRWYMFQNMGPAPSGRSGHAMATWQNKVFVLGGESYTTQRADDPGLVHVLDTGKIKYPPDNSRQSQSAATRKSTVPGAAPSRTISPTTTTNETQASLPPAVSSAAIAGAAAVGAGGVATAAAAHTGRTASIDSSSYARQRQESAQSYTSQQSQSRVQTSPTAKKAGSISIPGAMPEEDSSVETGHRSGGEQSNHSASPRPGDKRSLPNGVQNQASSRLDRGAEEFATQSQPLAQVAPPADAFYYSPNQSTVATSSRELETLRNKDKWMRAALSDATARGFVTDPSNLDEDVSAPGESRSTARAVEMLLALRQELASVKTHANERVEAEQRKTAEALRARETAIQDAAYYRTKALSYESGSAGDVNKIDRERNAAVERKAIEAVQTRNALERDLKQLQIELDNERKLRLTAEDIAHDADTRANHATTSHSSLAQQHQTLQELLRQHETDLHDHKSQVAMLTSSSRGLEASHAEVSAKLADRNETIEKYIDTVQQAQNTVETSNARATELEALWEKTRAELAQANVRVQQLETELQNSTAYAADAVARHEESQRALNALQNDHQSMLAMSTSHMTDLVTSHREMASRAMTVHEHEARISAVAAEAASLKSLHEESLGRADNAQKELNVLRQQYIELDSQLHATRAELAATKARHATALTQAAQTRKSLAERELETEQHRANAEEAHGRVTLLQNLMADHGISPDEPSNGTKAQADARIIELESHLNDRENAHRNLSALHADVTDRAAKVEEELSALGERHRQLEGTHLKAVSYVKGTEKMLRRMKDELSKYKERNAQLEAQIAQQTPTSEYESQIQNLRSQLADVQIQSQRTVDDHGRLQAQMRGLQSQHESALSQHREESAQEIERLQTELQTLQDATSSLRYELDAAHNANSDLRSQLSHRGLDASKRSSGDKGLADALRSAEGKIDWLEQQNGHLEQRCGEYEAKINLLLDHLDSSDQHEGIDSPELSMSSLRQSTHDWHDLNDRRMNGQAKH